MIANGDDPYLQSVVPGTNGGMLTVASLDMRKRTAARFRLAPHFCAVPLAAPEPQWGGYWGQGRRVRAKIRPPSSRKQLAGHCRAAAAR